MVPMPAVVVLFLCKTVVAGPPDANAPYTHFENREWAYEHSKMVCRRQEVQLYDMAVDAGADPQPFNEQRCQRAGIVLGAMWDTQHRASKYRFWRHACPTKIINDKTGDVIAWKLPECPHRDVVHCETDTAI